jgi:FkbM family methyltransferase
MRIGRRTPGEFVGRLLDGNNYKSVPRFFAVHRRPIRTVVEEVFSLGHYPRRMTINTPTGAVNVQLFSAADLSTLNLIFCRQDYYTPEQTRIVVDVGSNIGLSALYWLTRNDASYVYCYEPSPISRARLVENLKPFQGRFTAHSEAVSDFCGRAELGLEASGVLSSLDLKSDVSVPCRVVHINDVLGPVIEQHGQVDVLKIDSEGHEVRTLQAIASQYWEHIRCVNVDIKGASRYIPKGFHHSSVASAERFWKCP